MKDNPYRASRYKKGSPLTAENFNRVGDGIRANPLQKNFGGRTKRNTHGQTFIPYDSPRSRAKSLLWLTTDNTGLSLANGAKYDVPGGTATALSADDTYYIATPWNTKIVAPNNFFGYFLKDGTDWYHSITDFFVRCDEAYPAGAGAGIDEFTCYLGRSASTLNLGDETAFPTGIKCILDGFDNVNAGSNSRSFFNNKIFPARFDAGSNIIYLTHPQF